MGFWTTILLLESIDKLIMPKRSHREKFKVEDVPFTSDDPEEIKEAKDIANKVKFTTAFFLHLMFADDNKLSRLEKKEIKNIALEKEGYLDVQDREDVAQILTLKPSIRDVIDIAKKYNISYQYVMQVMKYFKICTERDPKYDYVFQKLERQFVLESEYMN